MTFKKLLLSNFLLSNFILAANICSAQLVAFEKVFKPASVSTIYANSYDVIKSPDDSGYYTLGTLGSVDSGAMLSLVDNYGALKWSTLYKKVPAGVTTSGFTTLPLSDSTLMLNLYDQGTTILLKASYSGAMLSAHRLNTLSSTIYYHREKNNFLYAVGRISSGGINGGLFCKVDLYGNIIWARMMNGGTSRRIVLTAIAPTSDGGFLLAGNRQIYSTSLPAATVLIKTDSVGNISWQRQLNYAGQAMSPFDVVQTSDGGFMFAMASAFNGPAQFFKTDSVGNALWNIGFEHSSNYELFFNRLSQGPGNTFVTAGTVGTIQPWVNASAVIDSAGNLLSINQYHNYGAGVTQTHCYHPQSGLVMFGYSAAFNDYGFYLCKTDTALMAPCISAPPTFTTYSYTVTDSATSILSQPVTLSSSDIAPQMVVSNISLADSSFCPPVISSVVAHKGQRNIRVSPVPATENVRFHLDEASPGTSTLFVYDLTGKLILRQLFTGNTYILNRNQLNAGVYYYRVVTQKQSLAGKIVFK